MTNFIHEHYKMGQQHIVLIMAPDRYPLQAWVADKNKKCLVRDDSHILTIQTNSAAKFLPADHFQRFCVSNSIDTSIPKHRIEFTYNLVSRTPTKLSNVIPFPTPKTADNITRITDGPGSNDPFLAFA